MEPIEKKQQFHVATATSFAKNAGEYVSRACYGKETVIITRQGKPAAAVIPIEQIILSDADKEVLLAALESPPEPNATLTTAMREFKSKHTG